jgi:hypothetical protein
LRGGLWMGWTTSADLHFQSVSEHEATIPRWQGGWWVFANRPKHGPGSNLSAPVMQTQVVWNPLAIGPSRGYSIGLIPSRTPVRECRFLDVASNLATACHAAPPDAFHLPAAAAMSNWWPRP